MSTKILQTAKHIRKQTGIRNIFMAVVAIVIDGDDLIVSWENTKIQLTSNIGRSVVYSIHSVNRNTWKRITDKCSG